MAKYNTFTVYDCIKRKCVLVTSSARKANELLKTGFKIEVWNENACVDIIRSRQAEKLDKYIKEEKQYIAMKQKEAEIRNARRAKLRI